MQNEKKEKLEKKSIEIRESVIRLLGNTIAGHIGGALSCCDLMVTLFYHYMNFSLNNVKCDERDRFIMSKGHSCETYLCILQDLGFITKEELYTFGQEGSRLYGHPNRQVPGVEVSTGALGHGLSVGSGMALEAKRTGKASNVYVMMGDGELAEGSVWEAAMFASNYRLDNLYAVIDRNHLQISGNTEDVMKLEPLEEKWRAFGFQVECIDGNNIGEICAGLDRLIAAKGKPKLLLADTVKGKGVSYMENIAAWHHGKPNKEQMEIALNELETRMNEVMR